MCRDFSLRTVCTVCVCVSFCSGEGMYKIHTPHLVGPTMPSSGSKRRLPAVPKWALAAREWIFSHQGDFERLDAVGVPRKQIPSSVSLVRKPFGMGRNQGRSFVDRAFTVVPWGGFLPNSLRGRLVLFGVPLVVLFFRTSARPFARGRCACEKACRISSRE